MSLPRPYFAVFFFPVIGFLQSIKKLARKKVIKQVKWPYVSFYLPLMLKTSKELPKAIHFSSYSLKFQPFPVPNLRRSGDGRESALAPQR